MEDAKNSLSIDALDDVAGGAGCSSGDATYVSFSFDYSKWASRTKIQEYIQEQLRANNVPESVCKKVPIMNPEKSYMSYGSGGLRVEWQKGWDKPKFYKTHD